MRISQFARTAAVTAAVFLSSACYAQAGGKAEAKPEAKADGAAAFDPALVDKGKRLYVSNCTRCHGLNMVAVSSAFFDLRTFPPDEKPRFFESVTKGKRVMPAWDGILKPEEIEALWAYVQSNHKK